MANPETKHLHSHSQSPSPPPAQLPASFLADFSFSGVASSSSSPGPSTSPLRRSQRSSGHRFSAENIALSPPPSSSSSPLPSTSPLDSKPKPKLERSRSSSSSSPTKKIRRGYADPSVYAHLEPLKDHLVQGVDVMFCGINPGIRSATDGHHFASPTNHFWRALHLSNLTPTRLPPSEDHTLPSLPYLYASLPTQLSLGLTNLAIRPTAEANELSLAEQRAAVPAMLEKIRRYRPGVVCFVGRGIWSTFRSVVDPPASRRKSQSRSESQSKSKGQNESERETINLQVSKGIWGFGAPPDARPARDEGYGLQDLVLVHPPRASADANKDATVNSEDGQANTTDPYTYTATLFFSSPSTSGRVTAHPTAETKAELFGELRKLALEWRQRARSRVDGGRGDGGEGGEGEGEDGSMRQFKVIDFERVMRLRFKEQALCQEQGREQEQEQDLKTEDPITVPAVAAVADPGAEALADATLLAQHETQHETEAEAERIAISAGQIKVETSESESE